MDRDARLRLFCTAAFSRNISRERGTLALDVSLGLHDPRLPSIPCRYGNLQGSYLFLAECITTAAVWLNTFLPHPQMDRWKALAFVVTRKAHLQCLRNQWCGQLAYIRDAESLQTTEKTMTVFARRSTSLSARLRSRAVLSAKNIRSYHHFHDMSLDLALNASAWSAASISGVALSSLRVHGARNAIGWQVYDKANPESWQSYPSI